MVDTELSKALALAGGCEQAPERGPKGVFSLERVLDVAIVIADTDGVDAVTLTAVA